MNSEQRTGAIHSDEIMQLLGGMFNQSLQKSNE